ncbi:MAG: NAD-dependent deacylase [Desulfatiglandaceae bacterium]|jgi:NAD-dependent deacetylase
MARKLENAARLIVRSEMTLALTGAGISVESGIPDFRSAGGLWERFDPGEYATVEAFRADPEKVWNMFREMEVLVLQAKPNKAHQGLGKLEKMGYLHTIITQNIDNLHQAGGARNVIEYHGNFATLLCPACGKRFGAEEKKVENPPRCVCRQILKPDVVLFGEAIPRSALNRSFQLASSARTLMVIGTSAAVSPANTIPAVAKENGAKIIEINQERTHLTDSITDIFLEGSAGEIVERLVSVINEKRDSHSSIPSI